mgnify:CR=1 FL=1
MRRFYNMINVNNLFVTKQSTIKDALIVIDKSSIGLALLVVYYRVRGTIAVEFINLLKG